VEYLDKSKLKEGVAEFIKALNFSIYHSQKESDKRYLIDVTNT
jgi:hypothetical protein